MLAVSPGRALISVTLEDCFNYFGLDMNDEKHWNDYQTVWGEMTPSERNELLTAVAGNLKK